jgi:hypothetical protein
MRAYVFIGPTIAADDARAFADVVCLPPVAQGDVWRLCQSRPDVIGIVDGYFDGVPSVWHKEILWALSEGVRVLGSASMGALRAAELAAFGMEGVGAIFDDYREDRLEDDDEVALIHGPPEAGYPALSEPMVNIRATLDKAASAGIIDLASCNELRQRAKCLHYSERSWDRLLADDGLISTGGCEALRSWLPEGRVDQKRDDALSMLRRMQALMAKPAPSRTPAFDFEWTAMWDEAVGFSARASAGEPANQSGVDLEHLLDELRLDPRAFQAARNEALLRMLALLEARRRAIPIDNSTLAKAKRSFRSARNLFSQKDLTDWQRANDLDKVSFDQLLEEEVRMAAIGNAAASALDHDLLNHLRLSGDYPGLVERARAKQAYLASRGLETPSAKDLGLTPLELRHWFFEQRRQHSLPDDMEQASRDQGFATLEAFDLALAAEYLYSMAKFDDDRD